MIELIAGITLIIACVLSVFIAVRDYRRQQALKAKRATAAGPNLEEVAVALASAPRVHDDGRRNPEFHEDEVNALIQGLTDLRKSAAPGSEGALRQILRGETDRAEALSLKLARDLEEMEDPDPIRIARAWSNYGAFRRLSDIPQTIKIYESVTEIDPLNPDAWNRLGHLQRHMGKFFEAQSAFEQALDIAQADDAGKYQRSWLGTALGNLALIELSRRDLAQARELYSQALAHAEAMENIPSMALYLRGLGQISMIHSEYRQAFQHYKKAASLYADSGQSAGMADCLSNLGLIEEHFGRMDEARDYHKQSLALEREMGREEGIAKDLSNLGNVEYYQDNVDAAEAYYTEALSINRRLGRKEGVAIQLYNLGLIDERLRKPEAAYEKYAEAAEIRRELGLRDDANKPLIRMRLIGSTEEEAEG